MDEWNVPPHIAKDPEQLTEQECYDALRDPTYRRAWTGRVTKRLVDIQREKEKKEKAGGGISVSVMQTTRPPDMRNVKYTVRHTWQDWKGKIATVAAVVVWLDDRGWLPDRIPINEVILTAIFWLALAGVCALLLIHWLEERDIKIERR